MANLNSNYKVVIIGFGRFGSLLHKILVKQGINVTVVSSRKLEANVRQESLAVALKGSDIIIPCVPISEFANWVDKIATVLRQTPRSKSVVVDVCSIKVHPAEVMLAKLPQNIGIIATHPVWGPHSSEDGTALVGLKFIYQILRDNHNPVLPAFLKIWQDLGQEMIELSPLAHDRETAYSHAFAFLVGEIGLKLNVHRSFTTTKGLEGILYNQNVVSQESAQLFRDMFTYNPFAQKMLTEFIQAAEEIKQELFIKA